LFARVLLNHVTIVRTFIQRDTVKCAVENSGKKRMNLATPLLVMLTEKNSNRGEWELILNAEIVTPLQQFRRLY